STLSCQLSILDLASFSIATSIPYRFQIVTETKTVDHSDHPDDKHGHPPFPKPPTLSTDPTQVLRRKIECRIRERKILHQEKKRGNFGLDDLRRMIRRLQNR
ncbi:hypothetical protein C8F04DRAFT_951966, partial [Mycena alexandri]